MTCENLLIDKALQRPVFGWGRWNRSAAYFDNGKYVALDGLWVILLGQKGIFGLTMFALTLTLPGMIFIWRFPPSLWGDPRVAAAVLAAVLLGLYMIDCLMNGFVNIIYLTLAGGLVGTDRRQLWAQPGERANGSAAVADMIARVDDDYNQGRTLKAEGRLDEALVLWRQVLASLSTLIAAHPTSLELRRRWCDYANDLAWLLANTPEPAFRRPAESVAYALRATEDDPDCATYWNTLGAAHYREGDFQAALNALDHAVTLDQGGTAFDHVFLAMAHGRLGNLEQARSSFALAMAGMERSWPNHTELRRLCNEAEAILTDIGVASREVDVS